MKMLVDTLPAIVFVILPLMLVGCADPPKPEAPSAESSTSTASAPSAVPTSATSRDEAADDFAGTTVLATRFADRVELSVRLPARPKGYGYDPSLTVGDRTLREYRYEDGDRTLIFVEAEPSKLPTMASATLAYGHGNHVVRSAVLPLVVHRPSSGTPSGL
jgi:hypothetical protein